MPLSNLPFITPDLPGTGGEIKVEPDHFIVEEISLYDPSGEGDHLFVSITRTGQTTQQMVQALASALGVRSQEIGYAGLKDKHARTTQVFSLPGVQPDQLAVLDQAIDGEVLWAKPHNKKLRPGHLLGNRFTITVLNPTAPDALERAEMIIQALHQRGLANFFGEQRFGAYGDNAEQGLAILTGKQGRPRAKWLHKLLASAYQSQLFNQYLALRIERNAFDRILAGDLAKKTETGGMFTVEDVPIDQERFDQREITFSGPLFGYKMRQPLADAAALEAEIQQNSPVTDQQWRSHRVQGNRRAGRLFLDTVDLKPNPQGFTLSFFLPKGAYATILLREILKSDIQPTFHDE